MRYEELPEYTGAVTACTHCCRKFGSGEVVTVSGQGNEVFCYSDAKGGCLTAHVFKTGKTTFGRPHRLPGEVSPAGETPNYTPGRVRV